MIDAVARRYGTPPHKVLDWPAFNLHCALVATRRAERQEGVNPSAEEMRLLLGQS